MDITFYLSNTYTVETVLNRNDVRFTGKYMFEAFSFIKSAMSYSVSYTDNIM
ncbi:MAG: hypothetical protein LBD56_01140 [Endomicrobium sp.]|nr:hypothetical protein [Endomicrobium sp.]